MTYAFRILSPELHSTANAAIRWFTDKWGLKKSRILVEQPFDPEVNLRPTFVAQIDDGQLLCIDVSPHVYSTALDAAVLTCIRKALPVKIFRAISRDASDPNYRDNLKSAKSAGIGVFEINEHSGDIIQQPICLSLFGLRAFEAGGFPRKYRQALQQADQNFRNGDPNKACSSVYDELEAYFRRFAKKCVAKGLWQNPRGLNLDTGAWAMIIDDVDRSLNKSGPATSQVTHALLTRIEGVTSLRNASGHKPKTVKERIRRDQTLRTRFENAIDLFRDFIDATKSLRI